jgi:hypothetical protein
VPPRVCQTTNCETGVVPSDDMHIVHKEEYAGAQALEGCPVHDEVAMAV